jgi:OmpA-OmpF porin, OOP family
MMNQSKWWMTPLAVAASAAFALPAYAQRDVRYDSAFTGPYLGANVGLNSDDETGFGLSAGYRFDRHWAVEAGYQDTGQTNIGGTGVDSNAWELTGVGHLPLDERFEVFGKLGFYRGKVHGGGLDDTNRDLTFGLGGQYNVNPQLGVRLGWQRYADMGSGAGGAAGEDLDMWKVGLVYSFR